MTVYMTGMLNCRSKWLFDANLLFAETVVTLGFCPCLVDALLAGFHLELPMTFVVSELVLR